MAAVASDEFQCVMCKGVGEFGGVLTSKRKCLTCDGEGCTPMECSPCLKCKGKGKLNAGFFSDGETCDACAGACQLWDQMQCLSCLGKGTCKSGFFSSESCRTCAGKGFLRGKSSCKACSGTGSCKSAGWFASARECPGCNGTKLAELTAIRCPKCPDPGMNPKIKGAKCLYCAGRGLVDRSTKQCTQCVGEGTTGGGFFRSPQICGLCDGAGRLGTPKKIFKSTPKKESTESPQAKIAATPDAPGSGKRKAAEEEDKEEAADADNKRARTDTD